MIETLKNLLARLRAWMAENERAHREANAGPCCSAPAGIHGAQARPEKRHHE
jgi:hypothetical protein